MSDNSIDIVLKELSKMQVDPKYFAHFQAPANSEKITLFEKKFRVNLPHSYKKFLLKFNGGLMLYFYRKKLSGNRDNFKQYKGESVCFLSIEELTEKYVDLKDQEWKVDKETANPYPLIPFCSLPNNELLVFVNGKKSGEESPVFDAFHEDFPSIWGIVAPDFTSFLTDYLHAMGNPKTIGDEHAGVASDYFDKPSDEKETPNEILSRTDFELQETPDNAFSYCEKADAFKSLDNYSEALLAINKAIELSPKDAFYYFNRGEILNEVKQYRAALIDYDTAVKFAPEDVFYLSCRAGSLFQLNKLKPALKDCNKAILLDSKSILPYMIRREIYLLLGEKNKAEADEQIIDKLNKKDI